MVIAVLQIPEIILTFTALGNLSILSETKQTKKESR